MNRLDSKDRLRIGNEVIHASSVLRTVYERRDDAPIWSDGKNLLPLSDRLLDAIRKAPEHGLDTLDYHYDRIVNLRLALEHRGATPPSDLLADLDLLHTDAFLVYGGHLFSGAVNPVTIDAEWSVERPEIDLAGVFDSAVETQRVAETLETLAPPQPEYARLRRLLSHYRDLAREEPRPRLPGGPPIKPGARDDEVRVLRMRLSMAFGDAETPVPEESEDVYDPYLVGAVENFQRRYGLLQDGVVGGATREALNQDPSDLVRQIEVNMERWRWLPKNLGERYALVNIAGFELAVKEGNTAVLWMRVVVGRPYRRTPVFSSRITQVVLNPSWTVPETIAREDVLPAVRRDPAYLERMHLRVFDGASADAAELDPATIDWKRVSPLRYRFRQDPGPWNALGRVKFLLPNPHDVYLHDTPERALFERPDRVFSSGCVRLEEPFRLLDYLLQDDPRWTKESVQQALASGQEQTIRLTDPLPVHILYWTTWVDEEGDVHFRKDIYGRDARLAEALGTHPPP